MSRRFSPAFKRKPAFIAIAFPTLGIPCLASTESANEHVSNQGDSQQGYGKPTGLLAVLGSIIGYLGAEVAQESLFERLLWPERYFNDFRLAILFKTALLTPMGGPVPQSRSPGVGQIPGQRFVPGPASRSHAWIGVLQRSRRENHTCPCESEHHRGKDVRDGFWVTVLRLVKPSSTRTTRLARRDAGTKAEQPPSPRRANQLVHHLKLRWMEGTEPSKRSPNVVFIDVEKSWRVYAHLCCTELTNVTIAMIVAYRWQSWFAAWWCLPLLQKLILALCSVRRTPLKKPLPLPISSGDQQEAKQEKNQIFEIADQKRGFLLIEGPDDLVRQFFRHYAHTVRDSCGVGPGDRFREVVTMLTVGAFAFTFPIGLLSLSGCPKDCNFCGSAINCGRSSSCTCTVCWIVRPALRRWKWWLESFLCGATSALEEVVMMVQRRVGPRLSRRRRSRMSVWGATWWEILDRNVSEGQSVNPR